MDVGCYCVHVSRTLPGEEPHTAQAIGHWTERGIDEFLAGMLHFPSGAVAHFDCALTMERCERYEVAGTDGYLEVPDAFLPGLSDVPVEEVRGRNGLETHLVDGADEYRLMVEHFADCVLEGREPRYSASEAARNMRTIAALLASYEPTPPGRFNSGRVGNERSIR